MPVRLPPNVQDLVTSSIHSITQLDLLLMLHSEPHAVFDADEIARRLRLSERMVRGQLTDLAAAGLVIAEEDDEDRLTFRYARDGARTRDVDDLAAAVARRKRAVHNLILTGPSDDVQLFSDAFRIRKEKDS